MNDRRADNKKRGQKNAGNGKGGSRKRGKGRSRGGRAKKVDPTKYWGSLEALPEPSEHVTTTPSASVVVDSLGRPPIPGHENASKHYFSLVYDRAANLAVALAAAGGLNDFALPPSSNGSADSDDGEPEVEPSEQTDGDQPLQG